MYSYGLDQVQFWQKRECYPDDTPETHVFKQLLIGMLRHQETGNVGMSKRCWHSGGRAATGICGPGETQLFQNPDTNRDGIREGCSSLRSPLPGDCPSGAFRASMGAG